MGAYEELLREQGQRLRRLRVQQGNPSLRVIEARAKKLFAEEKVSLPISTQSVAFGGRYVGQDKLMWLVRTLLSWDRFGRACAPPAYGDSALDEWYERWTAITEARPPRNQNVAAPLPPASEVKTVEKELPLKPPAAEPNHARLPAPVSDEQETGLFLTYQSFAHSASVLTVAFSPDSRLLASGDGNGTLWLWDIATGQLIGEPLTGHNGDVNAVAFSPDGTLLATAEGNHTLRLRDPATHLPIGEPLTGHNGDVNAVAFSPDGTLLATAGMDGTVRLWNPTTRQPIGPPLTGHIDRVNAVAFSPDGTLLATAARYNMVRFWDPTTRQPIGELLTGHIEMVNAVAFSPDGTLLAIADRDGKVHLHKQRGLSRPVSAGSLAERAMLYAVQQGHRVMLPALETGSSTPAVAFSPDSRLLATAGVDGTVR
ncbi:WD40 repeat domain-containing protein, partial [Streptomyces sp. NPDC048001]|uniref:WD40 repeat domain-containing protein n=1 Tax=Streptomyces sp. NPDC048001 TaxID=3365498 RepID=UPI003717763E